MTVFPAALNDTYHFNYLFRSLYLYLILIENYLLYVGMGGGITRSRVTQGVCVCVCVCRGWCINFGGGVGGE